MNDLLLSVILGIIEGVTEFLPVSSTAHLRIAQYLFDLPLDDPFWKMYAVVIQLGAVLCLPVYFRQRITDFLRTFPKGKNGDKNVFTHPLTLVLIAFVFTAVPAALLKKQISQNLESLTVIGVSLIAGGVVMWLVDVLFRTPRVPEMESMSVWQSIWIGTVQTTAALFPGVSRSMSTIAAGQTAGLSRPAALEFSFFLSMPTMAAATLYDLYKTLRPGDNASGLAPLQMTPHNWLVLAVGFVVSFFVAWAVVAWFMAWVRRRGFVPFAIYRLVLGLLVLLLLRG